MWGSRVSSLAHWVASDLTAKNRTTAAKIHCATLKRLRRVSAKNLSVYLCVATRRGLGREGRECVKPSCPAQLSAAAIAGEQFVESSGQRGPVAGFHQQARLLVLDHIAQTTRV